jgi:hypothetical protein
MNFPDWHSNTLDEGLVTRSVCTEGKTQKRTENHKHYLKRRTGVETLITFQMPPFVSERYPLDQVTCRC